MYYDFLVKVPGNTGRIAGHIGYGFSTLKIDLFAVEKAGRVKGIGHQPLLKMERTGKEEGCIAAFVETVNFSAPRFSLRAFSVY